MKAVSAPGAELDAIRELLAALDVAEPQVDLIGSRMYLRGLAPCYRTKHDAVERACDLAPGVAIINELRVAQPACEDADLVRTAVRALSTAVPGVSRRVHVRLREGALHLKGTVRDVAERRTLEAAAWEVAGGRQVDSQLTLEGELLGPTDAEVEEALDAYVCRAMNLSPGAVAVEYRSGVVLLGGAVSSVAKACAIEDLLRWHDRVIDVVNNLRVSGAATSRMLRDVS